jgi:hypothetical protein
MIVCADNDTTDIDPLNYSDDANIRAISFQVGTQRFPEGKAIANGTTNVLDPEMYALSQRNKDFADVQFAPTVEDQQGWTLNGKKVRHWSFRQNFKQTPGMLGGGLQTLADGRLLINISQYPNPPEMTPDFTAENIPTFAGKTFHVFWTTDHEMSIDYNGVRLLPA